MEPETQNESNGQIRRRIENIFNTNQIYELESKDVEIFRKRGKIYIDSNYEVRIPIFWRIDAVLKFDDLLYEVGNAQPIDAVPESAR